MNNQHEKKDLWVGTAKVRQNNRNGVLGDADQAYTNVIALAKNRTDFRLQVKRAVAQLDLQLTRLEEAELWHIHLKRFVPHKDLLALAEEVKKDGQIAFDVFQAFDD